jgi:hypothetical protein
MWSKDLPRPRSFLPARGLWPLLLRLLQNPSRHRGYARLEGIESVRDTEVPISIGQLDFTRRTTTEQDLPETLYWEIEGDVSS